MNLFEAVKTGKKIKRKVWDKYIDLNEKIGLLNYESIMADDWEPEGEQISLSKSQILDAIRDNYSIDGIDFPEFWKKLGFKE